MDVTVRGARVAAATGGVRGAADAPAAIFLHGAGMNATVWPLQTRYVAARGRRVFALDLPGHGRSEGPALQSIDAMADWVIEFMDAVGLERAALIGHSMGALAALAAAAKLRDRARGLGLIGVSARMPVNPKLIEAARAGGELAPDLITGWGFDERARRGGHEAQGLWMMGAAKRMLMSAAPAVLASDLSACDAYGEAVAAAARVAAPTRLILGETDRMTPAKHAAPLAEALRDAETVIFPGCGHMVMIERGAETAKALMEVV